MGYETEVPPVPDRLTEEKMIKEIKKSFKDQKYTNLEIPDAMRTRKLELRDKISEYRISWIGNFLRGGLAFSVLLFPLGLLFKKTSLGIPAFNVPRMYAKSGTSEHHTFRARNYRAGKFVLPIWLLCSYIYANSRTSTEVIFDEYYLHSASPLLAYQH